MHDSQSKIVMISGRFARRLIRPMCICRSLSLRKRNNRGTTVTAHVESKVN